MASPGLIGKNTSGFLGAHQCREKKLGAREDSATKNHGGHRLPIAITLLFPARLIPAALATPATRPADGSTSFGAGVTARGAPPVPGLHRRFGDEGEAAFNLGHLGRREAPDNENHDGRGVAGVAGRHLEPESAGHRPRGAPDSSQKKRKKGEGAREEKRTSSRQARPGAT